MFDGTLTLVQLLRKASSTCRYSFSLSKPYGLNGLWFWIERISHKEPGKETDKGLRDFFCQTASQSRWHRLGVASPRETEIWYIVASLNEPVRFSECAPALFYERCKKQKMEKCVDRWDGMPLIHLRIFASVGGLPEISFFFPGFFLAFWSVEASFGASNSLVTITVRSQTWLFRNKYLLIKEFNLEREWIYFCFMNDCAYLSFAFFAPINAFHYCYRRDRVLKATFSRLEDMNELSRQCKTHPERKGCNYSSRALLRCACICPGICGQMHGQS